MLLDGINHVALVTEDTDRFVRFYDECFGAKLSHQETTPFGKISMVNVGPRTELNVFEVNDMDALARGSMFTHGPIDHIGLQAADHASFVEIRRRLIDHGATDGFVTDFGGGHSVFFRDPDGLEGEVVLWLSNDGPHNPPGTPAVGYD